MDDGLAEARRVVERARRLAQDRFSPHPGFAMYQSILMQLGYVADALDGRADCGRLKDVIVGVYAVREFEGDPELADVLCEVQVIADRLKKAAPPSPP